MIMRLAYAAFTQCFYSLCVFVTRCQIHISQRLLSFLSLFSPSTTLFSRCTTIYRISSLVFAIVFSLVSTPASALDAGFFSGNNIEHFDPDAATCSTSSTSSSDGSSATGAEDLKDFVRKYVKMAVETNKKYGTPYETVLAQGVIESGYGKSGLTVKANNFHGIKAGGNWSGEVIDMETEEEYSSGRTTIVDGFRKYPTVEAGWLGYGEFITSNSRYSGNISRRSKMLAMRPTASMSRLSPSILIRLSKLSRKRTYLHLHPRSKSKVVITMAPTPKMRQPQAVPQTAARVPPVDQSSKQPRVLPGRMDDESVMVVKKKSTEMLASSIIQKRVVTTQTVANTFQQ